MTKYNKTLKNALKELHSRLSDNSLEDDFDLCSYIQYASRLASLGDESKLNELPELFERKQFAGRIVEILKNRCKQGWFEIANYPGEDLAISIIDAQDFYLFEQKFAERLEDYSALKPYFLKWRNDADDIGIDEECKEFLETFVKKFPIPEEERLASVNTPITEREYMLLEFAYRNVKPPTYEIQLKQRQAGCC